MTRGSYLVLGSVGFGAALVGCLELFRRSRESRCLVIRETVAGDPQGVFERLRDVEAEPDLIPGVDAVTVLERGESSVRYRVEGRALGASWWAVFHKQWERERHTLAWESEGGTLRLRQVGQVDVQPGETGTEIAVFACTRFEAPVIGPIATLMCGPLYLATAFRAWLRNAGRATATLSYWEQLRDGRTEVGRAAQPPTPTSER